MGPRGPVYTRPSSPGGASVHVRKILMVAPEAVPFAKTGGLGDVAGALPSALARLGHEVTLVLPRYRGVDGGTEVDRFPAAFSGGTVEVALRELALRVQRSTGVEPFAVDLTHDDIGIAVSKVFAPGLRMFDERALSTRPGVPA